MEPVMTEAIRPDLAREIERKSGENPFLCYQCVRCSSGCPLTEFFDYNPNQILRLVQIGDEETALNAKTPWLCAACLTCVRICPYGVPVIEPDTKKASIAAAACQGCGICASECPAKAIVLHHYTDAQILAKEEALAMETV